MNSAWIIMNNETRIEWKYLSVAEAIEASPYGIREPIVASNNSSNQTTSVDNQ